MRTATRSFALMSCSPCICRSLVRSVGCGPPLSKASCLGTRVVRWGQTLVPTAAGVYVGKDVLRRCDHDNMFGTPGPTSGEESEQRAQE